MTGYDVEIGRPETTDANWAHSASHIDEFLKSVERLTCPSFFRIEYCSGSVAYVRPRCAQCTGGNCYKNGCGEEPQGHPTITPGESLGYVDMFASGSFLASLDGINWHDGDETSTRPWCSATCFDIQLINKGKR